MGSVTPVLGSEQLASASPPLSLSLAIARMAARNSQDVWPGASSIHSTIASVVLLENFSLP